VSRGIIPVSLYLRIKHQLYATPPAPAPQPLADVEAPDGRLDVNTATRDQLRSFKGIGQMWADKIISGRPYKAAIELVGRHVMPLSAYERIQDGIVARP
jgi:DNA uptake protein ComE-like DNA-binding protein